MNAVSSAPSVRRYVLGILLVVYTFNFIDRQILSILLESIKQDLVLSDQALGFLSGFAFAAFYATFGIPMALWADRGNRRNLIAASLALWSAMTAACGLAQNFTHLALARIGVGIGEGGLQPALAFDHLRLLPGQGTRHRHRHLRPRHSLRHHVRPVLRRLDQ